MQCAQSGSLFSRSFITEKAQQGELEYGWEFVGDAAADAVVQELNSVQFGQNQSADAGVGSDAHNPLGVLSVMQAFMAECYAVPSWVDWSRIASGQRFFVKNALGISLVLLHSSLAAGFASARIAEVLACTGYMSTSVEST
jgi:hypothetical protein